MSSVRAATTNNVAALRGASKQTRAQSTRSALCACFSCRSDLRAHHCIDRRAESPVAYRTQEVVSACRIEANVNVSHEPASPGTVQLPERRPSADPCVGSWHRGRTKKIPPAGLRACVCVCARHARVMYLLQQHVHVGRDGSGANHCLPYIHTYTILAFPCLIHLLSHATSLHYPDFDFLAKNQFSWKRTYV